MIKHLKEFIKYKTINGLQHKSLISYESTLMRYINIANKLNISSDINSITHNDIIAYLRYERKNGKSKGTINHKINVFKIFFDLLLNRKHIKSNPILYVPRPQKDINIPPYCSMGQMRKMFNVLNTRDILSNFIIKRDLLFISMFIFYGLSMKDVLNLRIKDINFNKRTIRIKCSLKRDKRIVPLFGPLILLLKSYLLSRNNNNSKMLFIRENDNKYSHDMARALFRDITKKGKYKQRLTAKSLVNTFIFIMCNANIDCRTIQAILGYHTIKAVIRITNKLRLNNNILEYHNEI
jgi:site-specific recombinase XerD